MVKKDEVFNIKFNKPSDFTFNSEVAGVFDDMVNRSVPFYEEIQRMVAEIAAEYIQEDGRIYDLGCSTGASFIHLESLVPAGVTFVGIDDSQDMLDKCMQKMNSIGSRHSLELKIADLNAEVQVEDASVVILCLTLQFVRPIHRSKLLRQIFNGMAPGGTLILVEKILAEDSLAGEADRLTGVGA